MRTANDSEFRRATRPAGVSRGLGKGVCRRWRASAPGLQTVTQHVIEFTDPVDLLSRDLEIIFNPAKEDALLFPIEHHVAAPRIADRPSRH